MPLQLINIYGNISYQIQEESTVNYVLLYLLDLI